MSTETAEKVTPELSTGPVRCASWCESGGGHAEAVYADDQRCFSAESRILTSLYPAWELLDGGTQSAYARVYAEQLHNRAPQVTFANHDDQTTELTPEEALELARQLVHFAWVAEQDQQKRNAFELGRDSATGEAKAVKR